MRPGDHPEFFRLPPPLGTSRESALRFSADGEWFHEGEKVTPPALAHAFSTWISRHPDDRRIILSNGYDWVYATIDDAPFVVTGLEVSGDGATLTLSDGTTERWDPETTRTGANDALYAEVKRDAKGGPYEARFSRHAQLSLAPFLSLNEADPKAVQVNLGTRSYALGRRTANARGR